jgi:hypothetical protein
MSNFDLRKYLAENRLTSQERMSGMSLIQNFTSEIKDRIEVLKKEYPSHEIDLTSNDKWYPEDKSLRGTYTLSYSGPEDQNLKDLIDNISQDSLNK